MSQPTPPSQSKLLKAEGNALFLKNDFTAAYQKYTDAIQLDTNNAVLYCNRAACAFGLGRYMDACTDATKATELDPSYVKAWGRLAQARASINSLSQASRAWKRAIDLLPAVENLTPAQKKQKEHYRAELAVVQAKLEDLEANPRQPKDTTLITAAADIPWNRAKSLLPHLRATGQWNSSAWAIFRAYQEWYDAVEKMKMGRNISHGEGVHGYFGQNGVITGLSNALIADERVFHMADGNFLELYSRQLALEVAHTSAWSDTGARMIMEDIPEKLRTGGWDSVRPAISVTVRAWIMRGFIEYRLNENFESALEFYTSALDLLQWGRVLWKDVPFEDKGSVFQSTFIRGVKGMRLDMLLAAYSAHPRETLKFPLEEILAGADDLLAELEGVPEEPRDGEDFGFYLSFSRYPRGQAHAVRGFYYQHAAKLKWEEEGSSPSEEAMAMTNADLLRSSEEYLDAASYYPADDEKHIWYLHVAFGALFDVGGLVKDLLTILNRLHDALPLVKGIWEFGVTSQSEVHAAFAEDMRHRDKLLRVAEGKSEDELNNLSVRHEPVGGVEE
ncbi:hypothetical protein V8D89_009205 [Ganoderma adspersum]